MAETTLTSRDEAGLDRQIRYVAGLRPHFQVYWVNPDKKKKEDDSEPREGSNTPHEGGGEGDERKPTRRALLKKVDDAGGDAKLAARILDNGVNGKDAMASAVMSVAVAAMMHVDDVKAAVEHVNRTKDWTAEIEEAMRRGEEIAHTSGILIQASQRHYKTERVTMYMVIDDPKQARRTKRAFKARQDALVETDLVHVLFDSGAYASKAAKEGKLVVAVVVPRKAIVLSAAALPMPKDAKDRGDVAIATRGQVRIYERNVVGKNGVGEVAKSVGDVGNRKEGKGRATPQPMRTVLSELSSLHERHFARLRQEVAGS